MTPAQAHLVLGAGMYLGVALAIGVGGLARLNWQAATRAPWPSAALAVGAVVVGALVWPVTLTVGRLVLRRAGLAVLALAFLSGCGMCQCDDRDARMRRNDWLVFNQTDACRTSCERHP